MGGGSDTTTYVPRWARPYQTALAGQATKTVFPGTQFDSRGRVTQFGSVPELPTEALQSVAGLTPEQEAGLQAIANQSGIAGDIGTAGAEQLMGTLRGEYLSPDSNPYLRGTYDAAARAVTDQYAMGTAPSLMAEAARAGALGSSGYAEQSAANRYGLGENLGNLANQLYGGAYNSERSRQLYALQNAPGIMAAQYAPAQALLGAGDVRQQQAQAELDVATQNAQQKLGFPLKWLDQYAGLLGAAIGPSGGQTIKQAGVLF